TVFITIPMGLIYRNIIKTGITKQLKDAGFKVVILSPAYKDQIFIDEMTKEGLIVEPLFAYLPKGLEMAIVNFSNNLVFTETTKVKLAVERDNKNYGAWLSKILIYKLFGQSLWLKNLLEKIDNKYFVKNLYQDLFQKYKPDLVFSTHLIYHDDIELIKEAKKAGIKTVGMVMSWDNLTSKGAVHVKTDKLIVWNEIMKKEAVELAGFKPEDVVMTGIPQFDFYFQPDKIVSREEFFAKNNLDPNKKLIVYGAGTNKTTPNEPSVLKILNDYISQGKIAYPVELMLRLHPKAFLRKEYDWLKNLKNIKSESPGRSLESFMDVWFPTDEDIWHMVNLIYHCDLVINTFSTFTIDAFGFGKPVINICFDGEKTDIPYGKSVRRYFDYTHYLHIIKGNGVKVAHNSEELLLAINAYLNDPKLDFLGRENTLKQQAYIYDNQSAQRVINYLLLQLE
ncbi:MAG: hypothetical protein WCW26_02940, partial [Candidatus Buchananbacteria bacterium]